MLKSIYVAAVRTIAAPLNFTGLRQNLQSVPRDSVRFRGGSQFAIYDVAQLARMEIPWWTLPAIAHIVRLASLGGHRSSFPPP